MNHIQTNFNTALQTHAQAIEARLDALLSPSGLAALGTFSPPQLLSAMRYGVLSGGKKIRPFLVLECASLLSGTEENRQGIMQAAMECAAALECVHCYSLIHDDLPALDNDDLRRGKPTLHKVYDEATAILAGDALLTLAFQILTAADNTMPAETQNILVRHLATAAGAGGMLGGQILDISAERRHSTAEDIISMEMMKTGALLRFACCSAAIITQQHNTEIFDLMEKFGGTLGFAFQLADDILDTEGSSAELGKTPGKDIKQGKSTLIDLYGVEKCRALLAEKTAEAQEMLAPFGEKAAILRQAADFIAKRRH